jgi:hypothetical protein
LKESWPLNDPCPLLEAPLFVGSSVSDTRLIAISRISIRFSWRSRLPIVLLVVVGRVNAYNEGGYRDGIFDFGMVRWSMVIEAKEKTCAKFYVRTSK